MGRPHNSHPLEDLSPIHFTLHLSHAPDLVLWRSGGSRLVPPSHPEGVDFQKMLQVLGFDYLEAL